MEFVSIGGFIITISVPQQSVVKLWLRLCCSKSIRGLNFSKIGSKNPSRMFLVGGLIPKAVGIIEPAHFG
jgi:hypothetical protein